MVDNIKDFFKYDICWCADSENCTNTNCFRHLTNKPDSEYIFTCAHLMGEEGYCPTFDKTIKEDK